MLSDRPQKKIKGKSRLLLTSGRKKIEGGGSLKWLTSLLVIGVLSISSFFLREGIGFPSFASGSESESENAVVVTGVTNVTQYLTSLVLYVDDPAETGKAVVLKYDGDLNALVVDAAINASALSVGHNSISGVNNTILGGTGNKLIKGTGAVIIGGEGNQITHNFLYGVIVGGKDNKITNGTTYTTVIGSTGSSFYGNYITSLGGGGNVVQGTRVLLAGSNDKVSNYDIVFGNNINASAVSGVFVYSNTGNFSPTSNDAFYVNAEKGFGLNTNNPKMMLDLKQSGIITIVQGSGVNTDNSLVSLGLKCNSYSKGVIAYMVANGSAGLCGCNGEFWTPLSSDSITQLACSSSNTSARSCVGNPTNTKKGTLQSIKRWFSDGNSGNGERKYLSWTYGGVESIIGGNKECSYECLTGYHPGVQNPVGWYTGSCVACTTYDEDGNVYTGVKYGKFVTAGVGINDCDFQCNGGYRYDKQAKTCFICAIGERTITNNQSGSCERCTTPKGTSNKGIVTTGGILDDGTPYFGNFTTVGTGGSTYSCNFTCMAGFKRSYYNKSSNNGCIQCPIGKRSDGGESANCESCTNTPNGISYKWKNYSDEDWINGTLGESDVFSYTTNGSNGPESCDWDCKSSLGLVRDGSQCVCRDQVNNHLEKVNGVTKCVPNIKDRVCGAGVDGIPGTGAKKGQSISYGRGGYGMRTEWTRNGIKWEYIPYETYALTNNLGDCQWTCPKDYKKVGNTCEPPKPGVCASNLHGKFIDSGINLALYKVSDLCESEWGLGMKPSFMEYAFTFRADGTFKGFDESLIEAKGVWNWSCNGETAYTTTFCSAYVAGEKKPGQCDLSTKGTAACKTMHNPVLTGYVQYGDGNSWTNGDSNKWLKWQCPGEYGGEFVKCGFCDALYTFHTGSQKCYANYRTVNCGNGTKPTSWTAGYIYGTGKYTQTLNTTNDTYVYEPTRVWTYTGNTVISNAGGINNTCMYTCADGYEVNTNYKCNPITYSITYHLYGGSNSTSNPSTYTIETSTFSLKDPSKIGYTFLGWTGSNGQTASKYVYIFKGSMGNKEYHAKREPTTYTISYNLYGGSNNLSNPSNYTIETNTITLQNPTKNGYTFAGWTGSNGTTAQTNVQISKGSTGNKTYNAKRTADGYTITYNLNGGTNNSLNPSSYTIESSTITLRNPTRAGYTFLGWTGSNGTTAQTGVSIPKGSTGNKTYTANWKINTYTISYTLNSGTNNSSNPSSYTVETSTINLLAPGRVGYTFKGWSGSNGSTAQTNVSIPKGSTGNKNYTANWNSNTYTISYSLNGGTKGISAPTSATYDVTLTINNPTKEGYTFSGRNISGMDGTTHTIGNTTTTSTSLMNRLETSYKNLRSTSGTVTFSAQWTEAKEYTGHWACVQVYD